MDDARGHDEGDREDLLPSRRRVEKGTIGRDQNRCPDQDQSERDILVYGSNVQRKDDEDDQDVDADEDGVLGGVDHGKGKDEVVGMKMTMGG